MSLRSRPVLLLAFALCILIAQLTAGAEPILPTGLLMPGTMRLTPAVPSSPGPSGSAGPAAVANWLPNGVPVCTDPPGRPAWSGTGLVMTADGVGGAIVVWLDNRDLVVQIYAQRLDAGGSPLWTLNGVRVAPTSTGSQESPHIIAESDGGALIAWSDTRTGNKEVYVQRLRGADGGVAAGWPPSGVALSSNPGSNFAYDVMTDGSDGAFVSWSCDPCGPRASRVTASGAIAPGWPVGGVTFGTPGLANNPILGGDGAGGAFVVWEESDEWSYTSVRATRFTASGGLAPGWNASGQLLCDATNHQHSPRVVESSGGSAIVVWVDVRTGASDIFGQRVSGEAALLWGPGGAEICTAVSQQCCVELCSDGQGGAVAAWYDLRSGSPAVYGQRLASSGESLWTGGGHLVARCCPRDMRAIGLTADGQGGAVVVWSDDRETADVDIYAQHVVASGQPAWPGTGLAVCTSPENQTDPQVAADGAGGAIFCWFEHNLPTLGEIYAWRATGLSNLNATLALNGWSSPVVPRNAIAPDLMNVVVTPTLDGDAETTYLNWQIQQEGPNPMPSWNIQCLIDETVVWQSAISDSNPPGTWLTTNIGPFTVRGGRHTVTIRTDPNDAVPESNESDNLWSGQWVWSPPMLWRNTPVEREAPPDRGVLGYPNSDGMQFSRQFTGAWVVSLAARASGDDYDLYLYDDYWGSTSGFSNFLSGSSYKSNLTDYVVGNWLTPWTVYPAVVRYDPAGGAHHFFVDAMDAYGREGLAPPQTWSAVQLGSGRIADVYQLYLYAGRTYGFTVVKSGDSDLEIRMFPGTLSGIFGRGDAVGVSSPVGSNIAQLIYTATTDEWHPVVVSRTTGDYAVYPMTYSFSWYDGSIGAVADDNTASFQLAFPGARPNPAESATTLDYSLSAPGAVRLEIFDVLGRRLTTLVDATVGAGRHSANWDCRDDRGVRVSSGVYWARLRAQGRSLTACITVR